MDAPPAWIEIPNGKKISLPAHCTIGRVTGNNIVIVSERVSRKHAVIRRTDDHGFELIDNGSSNGTFVNGQRITQPVRLFDGCTIEIGLQKMIFRAPIPKSASDDVPLAAKCWFLLIEAAQRGGQLPLDDPDGKTFESWSERCRRVVETHRGTIQRTGDSGLLGFWESNDDGGNTDHFVAGFLATQRVRLPTEEFRSAIHFGPASLRQGPTGAFAPAGASVIFAQGMQKILRSLAVRVLVSADAALRLQEVLPTQLLGRSELREYRGAQKFFTLCDDVST